MRSRSLTGSLHGFLVALACLPALPPPTLAQQTLALPEVVVEPRRKPAGATNTRLDIGQAPARTAAQPPPSATGSTDAPADGASSGAGAVVPGGGGITGASTSVITREQIARAPQSSLAELIGREAGVQTTSLYGGAGGAGTTVDVRGFGATAASNTLVLIDGRRLNDWDSAGFDLSTLAKDSIERIEITRGNSGAVLYGDGAVGGVINIVTRSGTGLPNQGRIEGGFGSFNTREGNISASASSGGFSTFVNGNAIDSDGYRDNNTLQQRSVVGDLRWAFTGGSVYFNVAADDQKLGLPGALGVNNPFLGNNTNQLRDVRRGTNMPFDYADKQGARATLGFSYLLAPDVELIVDGGIRTKAQQAGFFTEFSEAYVDTDLSTRSLTPRLKFASSLFGLPSRGIAGIDLYDTDYESRRSMFKGLAPIQIYTGGQQTLAGYWQQTVSVLPSTDLSAGGRIQTSKTTARNTFDASAPGGTSCFLGFCSPAAIEAMPLDQSETNHAWHLGAEHKLIAGVTLIGRVAESFRVPNIDERIGSAPFGVTPDFGLRTQKSRDWEAGARLESGPFRIQSSYFDMRLTDEIHFDPVNFINYNLDPTRRRGVETIASWQIIQSVRLFGNLTYTDAKFREGPNAGNDVPLVSHWTSNAGLSWAIIDKALTLDAVVHYVGERRMDNDQKNFQPLIPSFTTVDLTLGGKMDQFFWSAGVANIFDVDRYDYAVASASTFGRFNAYPQPGRTFMAKAGVTW